MLSQAVTKNILYECQWCCFQIDTDLSHFRIFSDPKNGGVCLRETLFIKYEMIKLVILRKVKRENVNRNSVSFRKINFNKVRNSR